MSIEASVIRAHVVAAISILSSTCQTARSFRCNVLRGGAGRNAVRHVGYARGGGLLCIKLVTLAAAEGAMPASFGAIWTTAGGAPAPRAIVANRLEKHAFQITKIAEALLRVIEQEVRRLEYSALKLADQDKEHQRYTNLLIRLSTGFTEIQSLTTQAASETQPPLRRSMFEHAAVIVDQIMCEFFNWAEHTSSKLAAFGGNAAILGFAIAFLTECGAPAEHAFPALAFLLDGPELLRAICAQSP